MLSRYEVDLGFQPRASKSKAQGLWISCSVGVALLQLWSKKQTPTIPYDPFHDLMVVDDDQAPAVDSVACPNTSHAWNGVSGLTPLKRLVNWKYRLESVSGTVRGFSLNDLTIHSVIKVFYQAASVQQSFNHFLEVFEEVKRVQWSKEFVLHSLLYSNLENSQCTWQYLKFHSNKQNFHFV